MELQTYYISKNNDFELKHIFDCGQCFRWNETNDNEYIGIIKNGILKVKAMENKIEFKGLLDSDIKDVVRYYFDLDRNYSSIKEELSKVDDFVKESIEYGYGIRILNQDLWEMIISYIISANNNIPRIKGIIEKMSKKYGTKLEFEGKEYFLFPTCEQLKEASAEDFRELGVGFRDIRLFETTNYIWKNKEFLNSLYKVNTEEAREKLLELSGVGPKVADCILLFSGLKRFDVFPVDVWVRRVMNDLYIHNSTERLVKKNLIEKLAIEKFGDNRGIAQQYLFYWKRELA